MAETFKTLVNVDCPDAVASFAAPAAGVQWVFGKFVLHNRDSVTRTVQLFKDGTTAAFAYGKLITILAGDAVEVPGPFAMNGTAGNYFAADASAASVIKAFAEGLEITP